MPVSDGVFRILLVEDNPTDARLIDEALNEHGVRHEMVVLPDGQKAIKHLQHCSKELPDLVILDLNIPKHDGLEVLVQYRMNVAMSSVPIVVLTSSDSQSDRHRAKAIGVSAFIRKPLQLDDFLALGKQLKAVLTSA